MKTKTLWVIVFLMGTLSVFAQDTLRQGNLTYVRDSRGFIQSVESTKLVIEDNYIDAYVANFPRSDADVKKVFKTIFPKARAEELGKSKYQIHCIFLFNCIKQQLCYASFHNLEKGPFLLTLEEMKKIEDTFKMFKYTCVARNDFKVKRLTHESCFVDFADLYNDN